MTTTSRATFLGFEPRLVFDGGIANLDAFLQALRPDTEFEGMVQPPQAVGLLRWATEVADEQALAEARLQHLALAHAAMQAPAAAEAAREAKVAPGRLGFSQKLQASAQRPVAQARG